VLVKVPVRLGMLIRLSMQLIFIFYFAFIDIRQTVVFKGLSVSNFYEKSTSNLFWMINLYSNILYISTVVLWIPFKPIIKLKDFNIIIQCITRIGCGSIRRWWRHIDIDRTCPIMLSGVWNFSLSWILDSECSEKCVGFNKMFFFPNETTKTFSI